MRRFLVLTLTLALGLTALAAVPAAAGTRSDGGDDCTYVWTRDGRQCLTKLEIHKLGVRDTNRDKTNRSDNDKKDTNKNTSKDRYTDRGFDSYWLRFVRSRTKDSCDCLTPYQMRLLLRQTVDPDLKETRQILRYLYRHDCLTASQFRRHWRAARDYSGAELRQLIRSVGDCRCDSQGRYQLTSRDIRRLASDMDLSPQRLRRLLQLQGDQGCVSRTDLRRLDRKVSGLDYRDIFDILDWRGSL